MTPRPDRRDFGRPQGHRPGKPTGRPGGKPFTPRPSNAGKPYSPRPSNVGKPYSPRPRPTGGPTGKPLNPRSRPAGGPAPSPSRPTGKPYSPRPRPAGKPFAKPFARPFAKPFAKPSPRVVKPAPAEAPAAPAGVPEGAVRLHKALAHAGVASRRQCEQMIAAGRVLVNGKPVTTLPAWFVPGVDTVEADGRRVAFPRGMTESAKPGRSGGSGPDSPADSPHAEEWPFPAQRPIESDRLYVLLHKPRRTITTTSDPEGRRSVLELVPTGLTGGRRVYPVGRLDASTSGLLLLTNDGELAHRLTHARYGVGKQYLVSVRGRVSEEQLADLRERLMTMRLKREKLARRAARLASGPRNRPRPSAGLSGPRAEAPDPTAGVVLIGYSRDRNAVERTKLRVTLDQGPNRELRWALKDMGFSVRRLEQVSLGPIELKGLGPGESRLLSPAEVRQLWQATEPSAERPAARPMRASRGVAGLPRSGGGSGGGGGKPAGTGGTAAAARRPIPGRPFNRPRRPDR